MKKEKREGWRRNEVESKNHKKVDDDGGHCSGALTGRLINERPDGDEATNE